MNIKTETECREKFKEILYDLSKSQNSLEFDSERSMIYKRLEELYHNYDFRHYYSDIFSVLTSVQQNSSMGDINILGQNLDIIRKGYKVKNKDSQGNDIDISDKIKKLYDHVSLDIARISYSDAADYKLIQNENIDNIKSKVNSLQKRIDESEKEIKQTHKKVEESQKEYIAILGIFASIILTFIGGIAFSTSVLQNIHNASIYRIVFICLIIGIVLINVIYFLFYFIERLVRKNNKTNNILFMIINAIFIILLIITFLCWNFGAVEHRNQYINFDTVSSSATPSEYSK